VYQVNAYNTPSTARPVPPSRRLARLPQALSIALDASLSAERRNLEACIAAKFDQQYHAQINHFLPYLLSLSDADDLGAIVGLRLARESELFLEHYIESRIEQVISRVVRSPIDRDQVVEIGNLASVVPGTAPILFAVLAAVLHEAGCRWVVCTATPQVRSILNKMQFPWQSICTADPAVLGDQADDWGSYYASRPEVIVGDVRHAVKSAASSRAISALIDSLAEPIREIAANLQSVAQ